MEKNMNHIMEQYIEQYLSDFCCCTIEDLQKEQTIFTVNDKKTPPVLKILAYRQCVIVCTSGGIAPAVRQALDGKNRDELFEFPFVYGQTIHYIPDAGLTLPPLPFDQYDVELAGKERLQKYRHITGFENALAFDQTGNTETGLAVILRNDEEIIGIAGAAQKTNFLWEVGVDVAPAFRRKRIATNLIKTLMREVFRAGGVPFYSASVTNIGSQMVATRCGFIPSWVDTFGTTLAHDSVYDAYLSDMKL